MPTGKRKVLEPFKSSTFFKTNLTVFYGLSRRVGAAVDGVNKGRFRARKLGGEQDVQVNPTNFFILYQQLSITFFTFT